VGGISLHNFHPLLRIHRNLFNQDDSHAANDSLVQSSIPSFAIPLFGDGHLILATNKGQSETTVVEAEQGCNASKGERGGTAI
jgi:hypothetical protein